MTFSITLRQWIDTELVTHDQLRHIADISRTTMHRHYHAETDVTNAALLTWFESPALPAAFRQLCQLELKRRAEDVLPKSLRAADVVDTLSLDADGDGDVDHADAHLFDARKLGVGAQRRLHMHQMVMDGRITDDEIATEERLATEEATLGRLSSRVLRRMRDAMTGWLSPRGEVARKAVLLVPVLFASMC